MASDLSENLPDDHESLGTRPATVAGTGASAAPVGTPGAGNNAMTESESRPMPGPGTDNETGTASITADHVAAAAGVSRWTVSRAFKKDASISVKTRDKVLAVARDLGYAPDLLASSLASSRSNLVAVMVDDFSNPHKLVMLERLTRILRREGLGTLLVNMLDNADAPSALMSASQRRVDACVLIGTRFDERVINTALAARRIRKLVILGRTSQSRDTISIACDDDAAMQEMAAYLYDKGYQRPMFIAGPDSQSVTLHRKAAFQSYWTQLAGKQPPSVHVDQYDAFLAIDRVVKTLAEVDAIQRPDVLVCENDILAIGAMDALRYRLGLRVPQDIGVTGFDDIPQTASPAYDITTFRLPNSLIAESLVRVLDGEGTGNLVLPGRFIRRSSA